jgi:transcriptional regulator with XRE-family HTH domain
MKQQTNWLKTSRERLDISQEDLATQLQIRGFNVARASVSHWETGKHSPPLHDADFRRTLAEVLHLNVKTMLKMAGYDVEIERSEEAERIADIVDKLPPEKRDLALRIIEQVAKTS